MYKHKNTMLIATFMALVTSAALVAAADQPPVMSSDPNAPPVHNILDYGAVVNGTEANAAANVAALRAALNAADPGDMVYIPAGLYYLDDAVSIGVDNLTLDGYGATLKRVSTAHPSGYMSLLQMSGSTGVTIQGLTIDGNRTSMVSSVSFGIRNDYADNLTIKDCIIQNCESDGVYISNEVAYTRIVGCQIINNHRQGVAITDSAGWCVIEDCSFSGNDGWGIDIEPNWRHTAGHIIRRGAFDGPGGGLQLYGTSSKSVPWSVTVEDSDFINGALLRVYDSIKTNIIDNTFDSASSLVVNGYHPTTQARGAVSLAGNTFAGRTSSTTNLLTNGDFEQWSAGMPLGWTSQGGGTIAPAGPGALAGNGAVQITAVNQLPRLVQNVAVTPNAYYTLGGYISRDGAKGWGHPALIIKLYDAGQNEIKSVTLRCYYDLLRYGLYEKVMTIFQAPAQAVSAQVMVGSEIAGTFDARFDELFLFEGLGADGGDLTADQAQVLRFDFGPADYRPHADYIAVTPATFYPEPNAPPAPLQYGIFNHHPTEAVTGAFRGSAAGWSRFSSSDLALTSLWFPDEAPWLVSGFQVELPNGLYYVTVGAGNAGWDSWLRLGLQGRTFSATVDPENLYILDVAPDKVEGQSTGHLKWNLHSNLNLHAPTTQFGYIQTWGANNLHPNYADYAEILYLQDQIIEVNDERLTVYGAQVSGQGWYLNFLEIVPVPLADCERVIAQGYQLVGDIDGDCHVDLKDMTILSQQWLICYDPAREDCAPLW